MSARNRELMGLLPASLLITAGFAGVFIQRKSELTNVSLTYGAIFLGLCLAAHVFIRITLPVRRPVSVPAGVGARQLRAGDDLPDQLRRRPPAGAVVRDRAAPVRGDGDRLPRLPKARAVPVRDRLDLAGAVDPAAGARARRAGQRRLSGDPDPGHERLSADRVLQGRAGDVPGQLPARHAAGDGPGRAPRARGHDPAAQALRPRARDLGHGDGDPVPAVGHRLVADVLRSAAGDAVRRDRAAVVRRRRADRVRARRLVSRHPHPARPRPLRGLAAPVRAEDLQRRAGQLPARQRPVRAGGGRRLRSGLRPVDPHHRERHRR